MTCNDIQRDHSAPEMSCSGTGGASSDGRSATGGGVFWFRTGKLLRRNWGACNNIFDVLDQKTKQNKTESEA